MLTQYRDHVAERAKLGIPPLPLDAEQATQLVELLKSPPAGEEEFVLDLLWNRIPPGVDQAAYVKAGFLADITAGKVQCDLISNVKAVEIHKQDSLFW